MENEIEIEQNNNLEVEKKEQNNNELNEDISLNEIEVTSDTQNKFLESNLGKFVNTAVDVGLKAILPDFIEDKVIDVKDSMLKGGLKEGIDTAIHSAIDIGKSALGIFTGKFENISQAQTAVKKGGILDTLSSGIDTVLKSSTKSGLINDKTSKLIKKGKNVILNTISDNIEESFLSQLKGIEKIGKYTKNWNEYYQKQDLDGMKKEYKKIRTQLKDIMPLESTINEARKIENIQKLIQNKGDFNVSQEEQDLLEKFSTVAYA